MKNAENDKKDERVRCGYCGFSGVPVFVHGSGKCSNCRNTIDECCSGEQCSELPVDDSSSE